MGIGKVLQYVVHIQLNFTIHEAPHGTSKILDIFSPFNGNYYNLYFKNYYSLINKVEKI